MARYRLAKSFRSIILNDYSASTAAAYGEILRVLLAWSAFEVLMKAMGIKQKETDSLLDRNCATSTVTAIRDADRDGTVADFLLEHLRTDHMQVLSSYRKGESINVSYFISGIRHVFAHGILSAHSGGVSPEVVGTVCSTVSGFLLRVMDAEFSRCLDQAPTPGPIRISVAEAQRRTAKILKHMRQPSREATE